MTGSRPEPTPSDDVDPTGVRALLANLPDPGPMPDDLVARIAHSLELEQQRRAAAGSGTTGSGTAGSAAAGCAAPSDEHSPVPDGASGSVVSLAAERARRRPGRTVLWLGGAAAVAMVATLSVNQLVGGGDAGSGVSAQYPGATDSGSVAEDSGGSADEHADAGTAAEAPAAADDAEEGAEGDAADGGAGTEAGSDDQTHGVMDPARTTFVGLEGTVVLTSAGWADQVSALLASSPAERDLAAGEGAECLAASSVVVDDAERLLLGDAQWDDEAARLLIAVNADDDVAWVLSPDCTQTLSGPVTLTP